MGGDTPAPGKVQQTGLLRIVNYSTQFERTSSKQGALYGLREVTELELVCNKGTMKLLFMGHVGHEFHNKRVIYEKRTSRSGGSDTTVQELRAEKGNLPTYTSTEVYTKIN